jgi:hypothetical protein
MRCDVCIVVRAFRITDTELSRRIRSRGFVQGIKDRRQVTRADLSGCQPGIGAAEIDPNAPDALSIISEFLSGVLESNYIVVTLDILGSVEFRMG